MVSLGAAAGRCSSIPPSVSWVMPLSRAISSAIASVHCSGWTKKPSGLRSIWAAIGASPGGRDIGNPTRAPVGDYAAAVRMRGAGLTLRSALSTDRDGLVAPMSAATALPTLGI